MKYFCIWTVVVFGFLKVLVCKVSCGNGWLAKSYDSCSLTVVGRGIFFFCENSCKVEHLKNMFHAKWIFTHIYFDI